MFPQVFSSNLQPWKINLQPRGPGSAAWVAAGSTAQQLGTASRHSPRASARVTAALPLCRATEAPSFIPASGPLVPPSVWSCSPHATMHLHLPACLLCHMEATGRKRQAVQKRA